MKREKIELELEELGLTKSEIKVYLALLKIGASSTGPIISESGIANSKVYLVLDKLIERGLVSFFAKENVKHYKASNPERLLDYIDEKRGELDEKRKNVKDMIPFLNSFVSEKDLDKEAMVYSGSRGIKTAFANLVDEIEKGGEVCIMGVHNFGRKFMGSALEFQRNRSKKKIKAKFLINSSAKDIAKEFGTYKPVEVKFLPEGVFTPAIFILYNDKVIINLAKEMTFFVLKSQAAKDAFQAYFDLLWISGKKK